MGLNSKAQLTPPKEHWYKDYFPLVGNNGAPVTIKAQTGEDWFYDFCASKDLETNKPDGFVCVGYQRHQCNYNNSMPNPTPPNTIPICGDALYPELRDNVQNVNRFDWDATLWFMDLCGDKKWDIQIPTRKVDEKMEFRSVIQTSDGNFVASGLYFRPTSLQMNPVNNHQGTFGFSTNITTECNSPVPSSNPLVYVLEGFICKIDKNTHAVIWKYGYNFASIQGTMNFNEWGRFFDMVEDPNTKNITLAMDLVKNGGIPKMAAMEIEADGDVVWQKTFDHNDGTNLWSGQPSGALGIMVATNGDHYLSGGTEVFNDANTKQTMVVRFTNPHTSAGPTVINTLVTGTIGSLGNLKDSYAWDLIQTTNGKIFLGALEDKNNFSTNYPYDHGRIYELIPTATTLTATLKQDMGSFNAYDMQSSLATTKDGGFIFQSTKIGSPTSLPNTIELTDGTILNNFTGTTPTVTYTNNTTVPLNNDDIIRTMNSDVYLAKFDANGTLMWENTYPYTNYDPIVLNSNGSLSITATSPRSEIFQRECLYAVLQHPDGGYMAAGNNSANFDDHIVLKTFNECIENTTWDFANGTTISGNPVWTGTKNIKGMIIIPSGQSLTIDGGTIKFADTRETKVPNSNPAAFTPTGIQVMPGGQLIIKNNSLLTASCPLAMWDGIQIIGTDNLPQISTNQGYVTFYDSKVTQARVAFGTGEYKSHVVNSMYTYEYITNGNKGGGILQAVNGTFINNGADIELNDYRDGIKAYNGYIKNCSFDVTDAMPFCNQFYLEAIDNSKYIGKPHFIKLRNVECVTICGNTIQNSSTDFLQLKGTGIYAIDASMNVHNSSTWVISTTNETNFKNLHCAIETNTSIPLVRNTLIRNCNMTNVQHGISVSGHSLPAPVIVYNKIELNPNQFNSKDLPIWGIHLTGNDRYNVQENTIKTMPITGTVQTDVVGIAVNNRSVDNTKIYRNTISLVRSGIYAFGQNGDMTQAADKGLLIDCNNISANSDRDIYVTNDGPSTTPIYGEIKFFQGKCGSTLVNPAANTFSTIPFASSLLNIVSTSTFATSFEYNHFSDLAMTPINNAGIFTVTNCNLASTNTNNPLPTCTLEYKIPATNDAPIKVHPISDKADKMTEWNDKVYALMTQGGGNNNAEINNLRNAINDAENIQFNYWIEENKYADLISYLLAKPYKQIQDNFALANAYIITKDYIRANTTLGSITTTNTDYLQRIEILKEFITLKMANKTWNNIDEDFETKLATWSNSINKKTNITSQNVLRIVNDDKYAYRIPRLNTQNSQRIAQKPFINESLFSIYPNPNNGQFTYVLNKQYTVDLTYNISDVTGKIISKGLLENNSKTGYIDINANAGLYIIRINHIDFRSTNLKVVIQ